MLIIFYHDHTKLGIPRAPLVLPIQEEMKRDELDRTLDSKLELMLAGG
jgi:hypothetical protein